MQSGLVAILSSIPALQSGGIFALPCVFNLSLVLLVSWEPKGDSTNLPCHETLWVEGKLRPTLLPDFLAHGNGPSPAYQVSFHAL